ncbi:MAG: PorT family protein [Bacteroides sp.]|nr:PorT family protein [Bacteroides sp.]MCM1413997.1 PorT family protein [Bacteroides sp.]MCM1472308.1 PorT family protein [Bacteroides sp.]
MKWILAMVVGLMATVSPVSMVGQQLNDKLMNRPYADNRKWHLGFSVGLHTQDLNFTHNGFQTENGETWFMEQPSFSPGFCVNGLIDFRLNEYFSVRITPGLYFGNREIKMIDTSGGGTAKQNLRSVFVVAPIDLKFSAQRYRNARPYLTGGVMPAFDVSKKRSDYLKLNTTDFYLTVGLGCDFYLPFFKLNPEIKFCFGMTDVIQHKRPDLVDDPDKMKITQSLKKATSQMVVLTFYFE